MNPDIYMTLVATDQTLVSTSTSPLLKIIALKDFSIDQFKLYFGGVIFTWMTFILSAAKVTIYPALISLGVSPISSVYICMLKRK